MSKYKAIFNNIQYEECIYEVLSNEKGDKLLFPGDISQDGIGYIVSAKKCDSRMLEKNLTAVIKINSFSAKLSVI